MQLTRQIVVISIWASRPDFHLTCVVCIVLFNGWNYQFLKFSTLANFSENEKSHKISKKSCKKVTIRSKQSKRTFCVLRLCVSHWGPASPPVQHAVHLSTHASGVHACVRFQAHALKSTTTELRSTSDSKYIMN